MSGVKVTTRESIKDIVLTADDLLRVSAVLEALETATATADPPDLTITVSTPDGLHYESSTAREVLGIGSYAEVHHIARVDMWWRDWPGKRSVRVEMDEGEYRDSYFDISGQPESWVLGVKGQLQKAFRACERKPDWPWKWGWAINWTCNLAGLYAISRVFHLLLTLLAHRYRCSAFDLSVAYYLLLFMFGWPMLSIGPGDNVVKRIKALYPPVELRTGPVHQNDLIARRQRMSSLWTQWGVPTLCALAYDVLKRFWVR